MSSVISFNDVSLRFGGVQALKNVSFEIEENSLFAIIGPNGAGKTSILNCINGIYKPTSGSINIFDQDSKDLHPDNIANLGVSRTFQNIELFENMTALDNILIGAHRHVDYGPVRSILFSKKVRQEEEKARKISEDVIDFLEIEEYRYSYILSLPYGIQKRIELARALAMQPKVLLLDEPAAGMNKEEVKELRDRIFRLRDLGITIFLVEHVMDLVMNVSNRITVLNFGKAIAEGDPETVQNDKSVQEAYFGQ